MNKLNISQIQGLIGGLEVFNLNGYKDVSSSSGCIYVSAGGWLIENEADKTDQYLYSLGWSYDEDHHDWYFLVNEDLIGKRNSCHFCYGEHDTKDCENLKLIGNT